MSLEEVELGKTIYNSNDNCVKTNQRYDRLANNTSQFMSQLFCTSFDLGDNFKLYVPCFYPTILIVIGFIIYSIIERYT